MQYYGSVRSETISQALVYTTVNIAGGFLLAVIYFNAVLIYPYWRPLFWATVLSIPLHALKQRFSNSMSLIAKKLECANVPNSESKDVKTKTEKVKSVIVKPILKFLFGKMLLSVFSKLLGPHPWLKSKKSIDKLEKQNLSSDSASEPEKEKIESTKDAPLKMSNLDLGKKEGNLNGSQSNLKEPSQMPATTATQENGASEAPVAKSSAISQWTSIIRRRLSQKRQSGSVLLSSAACSSSAEPKSSSNIYFLILARSFTWFVLIKSGRCLLQTVLSAKLLALASMLFLAIPALGLLARRDERVKSAAKSAAHACTLASKPLYVVLGPVARLMRMAAAWTARSAQKMAAAGVVFGGLALVICGAIFVTFRAVGELHAMGTTLAATTSSYIPESAVASMRDAFDRAPAMAWGAVESRLPAGARSMLEQSPALEALILSVANGSVTLSQLASDRSLWTASASELQNLWGSGGADVSKQKKNNGAPFIPGDSGDANSGLNNSTLLENLGNSDTAAAVAASAASAGDTIKGFAASAISAALWIVMSLLSAVAGCIDVVLDLCLFLGALFFMVSRESDLLSDFGRLVAAIDAGGVLGRTLSRGVNAVVLCSVKMAVFHALLMWITMTMMAVEVVYIPVALTFAFSLVPVMPYYAVGIVGGFCLYLQGRAWCGGALAAAALWSYTFVDGAFLAELPDVDPYFAAMSFILGLWGFGVEGLILGPLLMTILPAMFTFAGERMR